MYELIVLGLIPGTQMQISFQLWAITIMVLVAFMVARQMRWRRGIRSWLLIFGLWYIVRRSKFCTITVYDFYQQHTK